MEKHFKGHAKVKTELKKYQQQVIETVGNTKRKIRIESLANTREQAMTKAFGEHEYFNSFADKTTDPEALKIGFEKWLGDVSMENDKVLKKAREYIDGLPQKGKYFSVFC